MGCVGMVFRNVISTLIVVLSLAAVVIMVGACTLIAWPVEPSTTVLNPVDALAVGVVTVLLAELALIFMTDDALPDCTVAIDCCG